MTGNALLMRIDPTDNVAVVGNAGGLPKGTTVGGITLSPVFDSKSADLEFSGGPTPTKSTPWASGPRPTPGIVVVN